MSKKLKYLLGFVLIGFLINLSSPNYANAVDPTINFGSSYYKIGTSGQVEVFDPEENTRPEKADHITIFVSSDSDINGRNIKLVEVGEDSGIFAGPINFSEDGTGNDSIKVKHGDTVYAVYKEKVDDHTTIYENDPPTVILDNGSYQMESYGALTVIDPTATGSVTVTLFTGSDPTTGITVILNEVNQDGVVTDPGLFVPSRLIQFTSAPSNTIDPGDRPTLQVNEGDTVTARYDLGVETTATIIERTVVGDGGIGGSDPSSFGQQPPAFVADCRNYGYDTNNDGICNNWITGLSNKPLKIDLNRGPVYEYIANCGGGLNGVYPLDPVCPNKLSGKDVFIKIDFLEGTGIEPTLTALKDVIGVFNAHGVRLHIQKDSNAITGYSSINFPYDFNQIKSANFADDTQAKTEKAQAFHYTLFANHISTDPDVSGYGEYVGNDIIITLDAWPVSTDIQEGTFMHELGHNFGLSHGGALTDTQNCKLNHLSAMSYSRQFWSLFPWGDSPGSGQYKQTLDYSEFQIGPVTETGATESPALTSVVLNPKAQMTQTVWGPSPFQTWQMSGGLVAGNNALDLDHDGDWNGANSMDINALNANPPNPSGILQVGLVLCPISAPNPTPLQGNSDWANLNYKFRESSNFDAGIHFTRDNLREIHRSDYNQFLATVPLGINKEIQNLPESSFVNGDDSVKSQFKDLLLNASELYSLGEWSFGKNATVWTNYAPILGSSGKTNVENNQEKSGSVNTEGITNEAMDKSAGFSSAVMENGNFVAKVDSSVPLNSGLSVVNNTENNMVVIEPNNDMTTNSLNNDKTSKINEGQSFLSKSPMEHARNLVIQAKDLCWNSLYDEVEKQRICGTLSNSVTTVSYAVPEFGPIAIAILVTAIASIIVISTRTVIFNRNFI